MRGQVSREGEEVDLIARGRHDPCVVPRAVPMVDAMAALVLADQLMQVGGAVSCWAAFRFFRGFFGLWSGFSICAPVELSLAPIVLASLLQGLLHRGSGISPFEAATGAQPARSGRGCRVRCKLWGVQHSECCAACMCSLSAAVAPCARAALCAVRAAAEGRRLQPGRVHCQAVPAARGGQGARPGLIWHSLVLDASIAKQFQQHMEAKELARSNLASLVLALGRSIPVRLFVRPPVYHCGLS